MNPVLPTTNPQNVGNKKPGINGASTPPPGFCKNEDIVMNIFDYMQDVGRPIAYYPRMAHFFGSVNASIMFSQLFYWQDRTTNELGVYKTAEEWTEETGLSYREQATARAHLVKQGFLIETHKRIEHRIYYKLNRDAICHAFDLWRQGQKTTSDESAIPERRKRNSGTTIPQSGECAIRNSGTTIPQPVYKTETTAQTTTETTADTFTPVAIAPVAGPVFPPIDDIVVEQAKPAPVGTVAVVEAAEVVEHTPTAKPKATKPAGDKTAVAAVACPGDVDAAVFADFLTIRKAKRAPLTATALGGIRREADKAGVSLEQALTVCCERGWVGFRADWYHEGSTAPAGARMGGNGGKPNPNKQEALEARNRAVAAQWVADMQAKMNAQGGVL